MYLFHWRTNRNCLSASLTLREMLEEKNRIVQKSRHAPHKMLSRTEKNVAATKKTKIVFDEKERIVNAEQQEGNSHYR